MCSSDLISEGEELLLDYGDVWEDKWSQLVRDWEFFDDRYLKNYVSATEYNSRHGKDPILTTNEQLLTPYPDNLLIRCHYLLESIKWFDGDVSTLSDWKGKCSNNGGLSTLSVGNGR